MRLRPVARLNKRLALAVLIAGSLQACPPHALADNGVSSKQVVSGKQDVARESIANNQVTSDQANLRITSFALPSGDAYFAASIQPSADDAVLAAARQAAADVVIIVDTSASQVGAYRSDARKALSAVLSKLRTQDRVRLYAADVRESDLSGAFAAASDDVTAKALPKLQARLPLGNTNLAAVLSSVRAALVAEPQNHTRSIIYIGDGSSIDSIQDERRFRSLVDALRADRISVHSLAIGPSVNIELMGILANQTGGQIGIVGTGENASAEILGKELAKSATISPIWINEIQLPASMSSPQIGRIPPLRLDRDSILIGSLAAGSVGVGKWLLRGETSASNITIVADAAIEPSHPDFSFLPGLVKSASGNQGLMLASASSSLLRETARVLALRAEQLADASNMALQQGNRRGARVVAELALEADPNNPNAQVIQQQTSDAKRLVLQNPADGSFDALFGGDGAAAPDASPFGEPAAGGDVFGDAPMAAEPSDNPLESGFGDSAFGEPGTPPAVAPAPPAAAAPAPAAPRGSMLDNFPVENFPVVGDDELLESGGDLLDRVAAERTVVEGRLRAEVRAQLRSASRSMKNDPTGVAGALKTLLAIVETTPDVDPQLRQELMSQVRSAIQIAGRREAEYAEQQSTLQEIQAGAVSSQRLLEETFRREARLSTLSEQLNALIDEGRYTEADGEVSLQMATLAGDSITEDSVLGRHVTDETLALQVYDRDRRYREMRERNFVDAFSLVLKANIPFVDEPPIVYPDADVWARLSRRRIERYGAIELVGDNETERRIQKALGDETTQQFIEEPLESAIRIISETHGIPIVVDRQALEEIGLTADTPVTMDLKNVTLRSFLRLMLREFTLTYMIKDEVLQITSEEAAELNLINKVYPVGDLVVPVIALGGGGMGGGGMGGGGMGGGGMGGGGMGGGMGGGGMGGGGMGGGMGGGGMGGGGAFAVPDDTSLSQKTIVQSNSSGNSTRTAAPTAAAPAKSVMSGPEPIRIVPADGQSLSQAWDEFFASVKIDDAQDLGRLDARIRATVGHWNAKALSAEKTGKPDVAVEHFAQIGETISAAMRAGHVQSWMYQALAIAQQATGAPQEMIERTLLSAVDFAEDPADVLHVAARLEEIGSHAAALKLCENVASLDPYRREAFVMGLRLAKRIDDLHGLQWACTGVLSQAWSEKFEPVVAEARLLARATYAQLIEEGRQAEADAFNESLKQAASHDAIVRVTWTGDADVDLSIEEPSGTVCSLDLRNTAGGGTLLGDSYPGRGEDKTGAVSETYMCPQGFSGQYRLHIRRVWGDVSTGHVTVELLTDIGRPDQRYIREQIPLTEKNALIVFAVKDGQRKEEVGEAQLASLRDVQRNIQNQVLAQAIGGGNFGGGIGGGGFAPGQLGGGPVFGAPGANAQALQEFYRDVATLTGSGGGFGGVQGNPFLNRGAVGFQPQITTLQEGAMLFTLAIISADRRYVRISPAPAFQQIGDVTTFNFVTGQGGTSPGGGGGGGAGGQGFPGGN